MAPNLCELCYQFDIRQLLLLSAEQKAIISNGNEWLESQVQWQPGIPDFFKHQPSLASLKNSSLLGCELCKLLWKSWSSSKQADPVVDDWLDTTGQGQLYIGTSGCNIGKREAPNITVTQRPVDQPPRTLCNFEAFATNDCPAAWKESAYVGKPVSSNSSSKECQAMAIDWYRECLENHSGCGPNNLRKELRHPTRVIDVGIKDSPSHPFLNIDPKDNRSWAALSYCWGGESTFVLNKETQDRFINGMIPLEEYPATLRDAIIVTQQLELRYLWIDALCIFQDSKEDWEIEAGRMRDVYAGAAVTIVAARASSTVIGIFAERAKNEELVPCELPWGASGGSDSVFLRPSSEISPRTVYSSPLYKRGWTLQEVLLSPRTLIYSTDQMIWECSAHRVDESGHTTLLDQQYDSKDFFHSITPKNQLSSFYSNFRNKSYMFISEMDNQFVKLGLYPKEITSIGTDLQHDLGVHPYFRWREIIREFTTRKLTKDADTLPALSGIASAFSLITKDTYCAGMWKSQFPLSLTWTKEAAIKEHLTGARVKTGDAGIVEGTIFDLRKPTTYRAPSWSWASINGGRVELNPGMNSDSPVRSMAAVVKIYIVPNSSDLNGQVRKGHLIIKGSLFLLGNLMEHHWSNQPSNWRRPSESWNNFHASLIGEKPWESETQYPALHEMILHGINNSDRAAFEFEQQHIHHPRQDFAAFLVLLSEGLSTTEGMGFVGQAEFLVLESTGTENEYRRVGIFNLERPIRSVDVLLESETPKKDKAAGLFSPEVWQGLEGAFKSVLGDWVMERINAAAWLEVTKRRPKRTTICII